MGFAWLQPERVARGSAAGEVPERMTRPSSGRFLSTLLVLALVRPRLGYWLVFPPTGRGVGPRSPSLLRVEGFA